MSKKLKEEEGQQSLVSYLSPRCPAINRGASTPQTTINTCSLAKKRTPPSTEGHCSKKANMETPTNDTTKELNKALFKEHIKENATTHPQDSTTSQMDTDNLVEQNEESTKQKKTPLSHETIDCMKVVMQELIDPIEDKINKLLEIQHKQEKQDIELNALKAKQSELYRRCLKTEIETSKLKRRIETLESKLLQSNLIIHGIREEEWESEENRREKLYQAISWTVDSLDRRERLDIARGIPIRTTKWLGCYRLGQNRPISVSFEKKTHADVLYESKSWLPKGVYIDKEYTNEVEKQRKLLRPVLKLARTINHYQGKCKLEDNHLIIQGLHYGVEDLHKLPSELSGFHASSETSLKENVHAFFGELSPFSNFHKAPFELENINFFCTEQFIQWKKATLFNNDDSADQILVSSSAQECKELGKNIRGSNEEKWKREAEDLCYPGLLATFTQNHCLKEMLLSTGNQELVEASYDTTWGTGIPLRQKDCLNRSKWKSIGLLGHLLMRVRAAIQRNVDPYSSSSSHYT